MREESQSALPGKPVVATEYMQMAKEARQATAEEQCQPETQAAGDKEQKGNGLQQVNCPDTQVVHVSSSVGPKPVVA
jgi:hypothetical protein